MGNERTDNSMNRRQAAVSLIFYGADIMLLFFPWIIVGNFKYNVFGLAFQMKSLGLKVILDRAGIYMDDLNNLEVEIWVELFLFGIFLLCSVFYMLALLLGKKNRFNIGAAAAAFTAFALNTTEFSIVSVCTDMVLAMVFPGLFFLIAIVEFITGKMMAVWEETKINTLKAQEEERKEKEEKQERLAFEGKYNKLFYRLVFKNFKSNWKDYILLLLCSVMVFTFIVIGFGLNRILGAESTYEGMDQIFGGLNAVLTNAIIPLGIISVIIIVILTFYYLRCRAKNYGIFLTLGMRKATLRYFVAVEFLSMLFITIIIGTALGTGVLALFSAKSELLVGKHMDLSYLDAGVYLCAVGALLLIYLIAFIAVRDIFYDFHMGHTTDLNAVREKMPVRRRKGFFILGILACIVSIYRYRQLKNFESIWLLILLFAGIYIALRYGIVLWFTGERKDKKYLRKLMVHNQLFHRSGTNTGYIFAMTVIQFCALFYFSFQMISTVMAEDEAVLYPYDIVCVANDEDEDIFQRMEEKCGIKRQEYPMIRISNYDSTEQMESREQGVPPQGQHIGISESTYHALRRSLDANYQKTDLNLDKEGEYVYIVHQQDKSIKAQPLDFYLSGEHPLLHAGPPCEGVFVEFIKEDIGYYFRNIRGEEIGSLTGTFHQGLRDNLVVFSDEYFEVAKELWKTTDMYSGRQIPEDDEKIPGINIRQGPTRLVLIRTEEENIRKLEPELAEFKARHEADEAYDRTVSCYYTKPDAVQRLKTERTMKITMNLLVLIVFFVVYLLLLAVKMATEADMTAERARFLMCMGMRRKERKALIRKELLYYYYVLPTAISIGFSVIFTAAVFLARQYTKEDMFCYIKLAVPLWAMSLLCVGAAVMTLVTVYVQKAEGKGEKEGDIY